MRIDKSTIVQFIKFSAVGVVNTLVSLTVYYIFVLIDKDTYLIGNVVGFIISVLNSYILNCIFVFKSSGNNHLKGLMKMYLMYGSTTILSTVMLYYLVEECNISEFIAPLITLMVTLPLNYLLSKLWVFVDKSKSDSNNDEQGS